MGLNKGEERERGGKVKGRKLEEGKEERRRNSKWGRERRVERWGGSVAWFVFESSLARVAKETCERVWTLLDGSERLERLSAPLVQFSTRTR